MHGLLLVDVSKKFGDFWAVRNVRMIVAPGRITGFIGPNGAGKTTLFNIIAGELKPDRGRVIYNDIDITGWPPWKIARMGVGRQFQDVRVFPNLTVLENVIVSLQPPGVETPFWAWINARAAAKSNKRWKEKALEWLEFVGLKDEANKKASELSFGQQKLLSFARLIAGEYTFLLLDEPTAGVHPAVIRRITELLDKLVNERGVTIALIEHNMSVVLELAQWVNFMHEGTIAFCGKTDHVLGNKEVREAYIGI